MSEQVIQDQPVQQEPVQPEQQSAKPMRPKRKCTEKQLAALAAGRAKNPRYKPKPNSDKKE